MPYQYKKLKGRIIEKYSSHKNFAKSLGNRQILCQGS